jgi:hypothetical protein
MYMKTTAQGLRELYLWDEGEQAPRGIEKSCIVLTEGKAKELFEMLADDLYPFRVNLK